MKVASMDHLHRASPVFHHHLYDLQRHHDQEEPESLPPQPMVPRDLQIKTKVPSQIRKGCYKVIYRDQATSIQHPLPLVSSFTD
ncbi:hypothetical protein L1887_07288 [Cichorium endivia]|nr:hypothetical protein L1887_07288 [Cichorium endivia]